MKMEKMKDKKELENKDEKNKIRNKIITKNGERKTRTARNVN